MLSSTRFLIFLVGCASTVLVQAESQTLDYLGYVLSGWKGTIAFAFISALFIVASIVAKTDIQKEHVHDIENPTIWEDPHQLAEMGHINMEFERKMDVRFNSLYTNRPWRTVDAKFQFGGDNKNIVSNLEWMGGQAFPNGEMRTDSVFSMTIAFWKFMLGWKTKGARWCILMKALGACINPIQVGITSKIVFLIQHPDSHSIENKRSILGFYCFMIVVLGYLATMLDWSYELEVPQASVRRELKLRLQNKFVQMTGKTAAAWPPGKCTSVLAYDVEYALKIWIAIFDFADIVATIFATFFVTALINADFVFVAQWDRAETNFIPVLLLVPVACFADFYFRRGHILDLSKRKHGMLRVESALSTLQISLSRVRLADDTFHQDEARLTNTKHSYGDDFFSASFVVWYRWAHSGLCGKVAGRACATLTRLATAILTFIAGVLVMDGSITLAQFTAVILALKILADTLEKLSDTMTQMYQNLASLQQIAEVFNVDEPVFAARGVESDSNNTECSDDTH